MTLKIVSFYYKGCIQYCSCCHAFVMILGPAIEVSITTVYHLLKGTFNITLPENYVARHSPLKIPMVGSDEEISFRGISRPKFQGAKLLSVARSVMLFNWNQLSGFWFHPI